jgi:hypothetical protein
MPRTVPVRALTRVAAIAIAAALATVGNLAHPAPATAASGILYVDGKIGYDPAVGPSSSTTWGRSTAKPFKTVERALEETRFGLPSAIRIKGYSDYVYRETITQGYALKASAGAPLTISAYTAAEGAAAGVRPVIDGGIEVGTSGWHRPSATSYPHVWCKTWSPPGANLMSGEKVPPGYDSSYRNLRQERFYLDTTQPLNRPAEAPTMAQLNAQKYSQYWNPSKSTDNLCVHLGRWEGTSIPEDPARHRITVPWYRGIVLAGGSAYVTIRDVRIRHTIMGVGISVTRNPEVGKAHHNTVSNVDASYNYRMGFWTGGDYNVFDSISGSRNSIQLVKLDSGTYTDGTPYGAQHNVIRNARGIQNLSHGVKLYGKLVRYNVIETSLFDATGLPDAARSPDPPQGIQISNGSSYNDFLSNTIRGMARGLELYQYDANGGPLVGNVVSGNRFEHNGTGVFMWDAKVASSFGTGSMTFDHNIYYNNQVAIGGNATTSGKTFNHETIYHSGYRNNPGTPSVDSPGVALMTGTITIKNSIIDDSNGPSICPRQGATVLLSYSDTYRWRNDPRTKLPHGTYCYSTTGYPYGVVKVGTGVVHVSPGYSTDPGSSSFLVLPSSSPLYKGASDGTNVGAT